MAKFYAQEIARFGETLSWVAKTDIALLRAAIAQAAEGPLVAVGSGGSLTAASALAFLHQQFVSQIAAVATPLEAAADPLQKTISTWLLSAGGNNVDILASFRALVRREARQLAVLCGRADSPLSLLAQTHGFVDLLVHEPPTGRDGFLATNSLLGFVGLLTRAYCETFQGDVWQEVLEHVEPLIDPTGLQQMTWKAETAFLWERRTTVVLHGPATRVGAIDLESKFTEAALGNLQVADWRNFAHGRHHWLAKHGDDSSILALISSESEAVAERTLALIPPQVPVARLRFDGSRTAALLGSLVAALCVTWWAGMARGIDPGRPGVPEFGRRLYHLPLPKPRTQAGPSLLEADRAAIVRKAGVGTDILAGRGELGSWHEALERFRSGLGKTAFLGIVLDYDGTLVDTRRRFARPEPEVVEHLLRLIRGGVQLAVATGRGRSVRQELQAVLPRELWDQVIIGYYNGGEIATLAEDAVPDRHGLLCESLVDLAEALRAQPELAAAAEQVDRPRQITLQPRHTLPEARLWDLAQQVILSCGRMDLVVTRSSHSIDILPRGTTKRAVLNRLRSQAVEGAFLAVGDRGRWPGNDYDLLQEPHALSVDEVSVDRSTCWHLGSPGQRGVKVLLEYFGRLHLRDGVVRYTG
jgi:hydroxymethylpyrimidine pyrophosphatase-like HAD family hydrolase